MESYPARCIADTLCLASIAATFAGWLPVILAGFASLAAGLHYSLLVYDRLRSKDRPYE